MNCAASTPGEHPVLTCSALKHKYRDRLRRAVPGLGFVFLELTPEVAADRVSHRPGHFMPSSLIDSQFATLESPVGEPLTLALNASNTASRNWPSRPMPGGCDTAWNAPLMIFARKR